MFKQPFPVLDLLRDTHLAACLVISTPLRLRKAGRKSLLHGAAQPAPRPSQQPRGSPHPHSSLQSLASLKFWAGFKEEGTQGPAKGLGEMWSRPGRQGMLLSMTANSQEVFLWTVSPFSRIQKKGYRDARGRTVSPRPWAAFCPLLSAGVWKQPPAVKGQQGQLPKGTQSYLPGLTESCSSVRECRSLLSARCFGAGKLHLFQDASAPLALVATSGSAVGWRGRRQGYFPSKPEGTLPAKFRSRSKVTDSLSACHHLGSLHMRPGPCRTTLTAPLH